MAAAIARGDTDTAFGSMIESQSVGKFEAWFARSDSGGRLAGRKRAAAANLASGAISVGRETTSQGAEILAG